MNETVSKVVDAIPATVWIFLFTIVLAALSWLVKGQFDQDARMLVMEKRQEMMLQLLTPHSVGDADRAQTKK